MLTDALLSRNLVPDAIIRQGIRSLLRQRLREEDAGSPEARQRRIMDLVDQLKKSPIAIDTQAANEQHYTVPTEFYQNVLGKHLKYSCGLWKEGETSLDASEEAMLSLVCERAELKNCHRVLELGVGWGSLSLYMAARYPKSQFIGVSNSPTQKEYIDHEIRARGLKNLAIITQDINRFDTDA